MALFNYECDEIKRKIEEVSPNYPQLTTYTSEWLYFYENEYNAGTPVELEYKTVNISPSATVLNAIPYPYKSAILKGNTKYRDIDTGDILDTFDETKNLELVPVKRPVLTAMGENLIDSELIAGWLNTSNGEINNLTSTTTCATKDLIKVKPATQYSVYQEYDKRVLYAQFNETQELINFGTYNQNGFTTHSNAGYVRLFFETPVNEKLKVMLYEGGYNPNISYEPYQSNILTVNEEVELRGIGEVKDELNLLTGDLTERIREIVLDGSENWESDTNSVGVVRYILRGVCGDLSDVVSNSSLILCDKFKASANIYTDTNDGIQIIKSSGIFFIDNSVDSLEAFVNKLKTSNIKVQYSIIEKPVKTVNMNKLNKPYEGTNHYQLTSNIPCEAILEVPVVSTGEQTLQEIND